MKKIFNIGFLFAVAAGFVACSDDNDAGSSYLRENPVQVVSSNLFFNANAQKGGVKFTAPAGSTVSVSETWATAELKNDSVVVSVTNNAAVDSRSAVLTIKNGADSTNVPILQTGAVFKYTGEKYYVVSDEATALTLPYTKVGAEPAISLADNGDASVVASTEDKGNAFVAHFNANTTGEVRTVNLVLKNQDKCDTIMVTQGSLNDFIGKEYHLYGYDLLKLTSSTTSMDQLVTQISGKLVKVSDSEVALDVNDSEMELHFGFDPSTLSFSIKGDDVILKETAASGVTLRKTAIWDKDFYAALAKLFNQATQAHSAGKLSDDEYNSFVGSTVPAIFDIFASRYLSMSAPMLASKEDGVVMGLFADSGTNADFIGKQKGLGELGFPINNFNANMLGVYEYTRVGQKDKFKKPLLLLQVPLLYHMLPQGSNAKPADLLRERAKVSLPMLKAMAKVLE